MSRLTVKVVVEPKGVARLKRALASLKMPQQARIQRRFLLTAAFAVAKDAAENQIIRGGRVRGPAGPRGGKGKLTDTKPHPTRLPSRTGALRRSLGPSRGVDRAGLPTYIEVGSDLVYARVHELGLNGRPRPFLAPALTVVSQKFEEMLMAEVVKSLDEADR